MKPLNRYKRRLIAAATLLATSALLGFSTPSQAGPDPFLGEISWFAGNYAPRGWAFCDGQLLDIASHQALFALLGTTYGGDGRTTFALPDMRGRSPLHAGTGPGLTPKRLGARAGEETVTLTTNEIPSHSHSHRASSNSGTQRSPTATVLAENRRKPYSTDNPDVSMNSASISPTGGNQAHNNMPPFNTLHCIIALQGTFPPRN